jgi:hypothetical protein
MTGASREHRCEIVAKALRELLHAGGVQVIDVPEFPIVESDAGLVIQPRESEPLAERLHFREVAPVILAARV